MGNAYGVVSRLASTPSLRLCRLRRPRRRLSTSVPNNGSPSLTPCRFASGSKPHCPNTNPDPNLNLQSLNKTISRLVRNGRIGEARDLFDRMKHRNVVTWNSMLGGYVKSREIVKARKVFDEMPERDVVSWNLMISGYVSCHGDGDRVEEGRKLFDRMPERDTVSWNTMLSGYARNGRMSDALRLFNTMPGRNVVSWNAVITGFAQNGDVASAVRLFEDMPERDAGSFCALVSGLVRNGALDEAARVLLECGIRDDQRGDLVNAYNTLIAGYGQRGRVEEARRLFDEIPRYHNKSEGGNMRFERNVVSWNSMIMCYLKAKDIIAARQLFDQMTERDTFSWNTMITGYVHISDMEEAFNLFCKMPYPDILTRNLMVSGFAGVGELELAHEFFDRIPRKNLVSWNSIIAGYEKNEYYKESVGLFIKMQFEGEKHDCHTLSSILSCSTGLVDLHLGRQVHQLVIKTLIPDVTINNSFITMYSRCGAIREARTIFDEMKLQKDVISWNAMIGGYGSHGFAVEALELFELMKHRGLKPTHITFIAVLNTCANAGLVEEGRRFFRSMTSEFGIKPSIEHYASLVDVIGRHGQLEEAMELINAMPFAPDMSVWGALLGACRVHNNAKLAQLAAEALMRLAPESSAPYVMLYNIYADLGQWDDAAKVRLVMEQHNVIKERGCSRVDSSYF